MTFQVWEDYTESLLRIPESNFGLFGFHPGNILRGGDIKANAEDSFSWLKSVK
jgi:hypothetical protein